MIKKVVKKQNLQDLKVHSMNDDLDYWLTKSPEERILTVEFLRRQYNESTAGLSRTVRVIKQRRR